MNRNLVFGIFIALLVIVVGAVILDVSGFVTIFVILFALLTMVGVMYMILSEKHVDSSKVMYVTSPYPEAPAKTATDAPDSPAPDPNTSAHA